MRRHCKSTFIVSLSVLLSGYVYGAGFEKSVMWSAKHAAVGAAVSSSVSDSESLFFNPAGLAAVESTEVSANLSPTLSKFSGPLVTPGLVVDSNRSFSIPLGLFLATQIQPHLGVGIGFYTSGGTKAIYDNVDFSALNAGFAPLKPTIKSDLSVNELSLGAGYDFSDGWRVGVGYRIAFVRASLGTAVATLAPAPATLLAVTLDDLSDTKFSGIRLGAQYSPQDAPWGIGATFRSELSFTATGTSSGQIITQAGGTPLALTGGPVSVSNAFPFQFSAGAHYDIHPKQWRVMAEYTFTQYSKDQALVIQGNIGLPAALGGGTRALPTINQLWNDLHNFRLGSEYIDSREIHWRAGYVLTTAVTPKETARATFSSPGPGHTFVIGAGSSFFDPRLIGNAAFEYSFASGTVSNEQPLTGSYSSNAFAFHLGASYTL